MRTLLICSCALVALAVVGVLVFAGSADAEEVSETKRPSVWAEPMPDIEGLPNFHRISPTLYRGAQPDDEGFATLRQLGVKTVVNLRTFHSDRSECRENGLKYVHISVQAWEGEEDEVVEFLRVIADPANHPVFVHCKHGADRTGVMSAVYRLVVEGWTKEEALAEMTKGGFGFHSIWQNLIEFVEELDVDGLRRQAGLEPAGVKSGKK